jgi:hypothetical protein
MLARTFNYYLFRHSNSLSEEVNYTQKVLVLLVFQPLASIRSYS